MGKVYKKSDCTIVNGRIVHGDEVVNIKSRIVEQANRLETLVQKTEFLKAQPEEQKAPSLDGFVRKSTSPLRKFVVDTPIMDRKVEEARKFMEELDSVEEAKSMNVLLETFDDLYEFTASDVVFDEDFKTAAIDTPVLGNILEWTPDVIQKAIAFAFGYGVDDE